MRFKSAVLGVCLVALTGLRADAADAKTLRVRQCTVFSTKANGKPWDIGGGKPDLKVLISKTEFFGKEVSTKKVANTYSTDFNQTTLKVAVGEAIQVKVIDVDLSNPDTIGTFNLVISQEILALGRFEIPRFGRVSSLKFELE